MGLAEKIVVGAVGVLYAGLLALLVRLGHGPAAVLFLLMMVIKAGVYFGGIRKLVTMQSVPRPKPMSSPAALLAGSTVR